MATIDAKEIIDEMIANNGHYDDDPPVIRIVEFESAWGNTCWGVVWLNEPVSSNRYLIESEFVRNPRVIWERKDLLARHLYR